MAKFVDSRQVDRKCPKKMEPLHQRLLQNGAKVVRWLRLVKNGKRHVSQPQRLLPPLPAS
jgi:hypothetical protein